MSDPKMTGAKATDLSLDAIASALAPYRVPLSPDQLNAISLYVDKLISWNRSVNLTALEDPLEIVAQHFGESMFAASLLPMSFGRLADVGTGAGFPGLALKIAIPGLEVTLLEPNGKKCAFLAEMQRILGLTGVSVVRNRYEELRADAGSFDFICSRALGDYKRMLTWARKAIKSDGHVLLWLGIDDSILVGRTKGWTWEPPVKIPESQRRVILRGHPLRE
jgi:16S rRNA (guanine527-N7)-methyltransferase